MGHTPIRDRFSGKVAIVTGGAQGIGRAITEELLREGATVVFTGLSAAGEATEAELQAAGLECRFVRGDHAEEAFGSSVVAGAVATYGTVHLLVNNAFSFTAKAMEATTADWMRSFAAGPLAYARMVQAAAPVMAAAGGGAIVNVSSISAHIAQPNRWTYNAAKGAVAQLTRCQALDLAPMGIRVNSVDPAWIWSNETDKAADLDGGGREKWGPGVGSVPHAAADGRGDRGRPADAVPAQRRRVVHHGRIAARGRWVPGDGPGGPGRRVLVRRIGLTRDSINAS